MKRKIKRTVLFFLVIILLAIVIRMAVGEPCKVPSESMEPTIPAGSWLWIDKFSYGGRLPERWADIPLVNVFTHIPALLKADRNNHWPYRRLPGMRKPQVGDIVVFNSPEDEEILLVKRIIEIEQREETCYFVQGDNRDNSRDSRFFGWVPERLIVGKVNETKN